MMDPTRKALLLDAYYQVLDNFLFRVLLFLVLLLVLAAFLIAFTEQGIELAFGWTTITYDQILDSVGTSAQGIAPAELKAEFIRGLQQVFVAYGVGWFGIMLCIASTAFFVPRMLEKGSADITFSKPLSRLRLLLARYLAGVLFVIILAGLLIGGVYLSIWIRSGYNDPGFLWSALTLIYVYALIHSVSTLMAVLTRSTVAAILVAILFFPLNGCVHGSWIKAEFKRDTSQMAQLQARKDQEAKPEDAAAEDAAPQTHWLLRSWYAGRTVLHYVLPKTRDADFISAMLMKSLGEGTELIDEEGRLTIGKAPEGFVRTAPTGDRADLDTQPAVWVARDEKGDEPPRIEISRKTWVEETRGDRVRKRSVYKLADDLVHEVAAGGVDLDAIVEQRISVDWVASVLVVWTDLEHREHRTVLFPYGDWLFELQMTADPAWRTEDQRAAVLDTFLAELKIAPESRFLNKDQWYAARFGWTAPLKYNAFFSIASSAAFVVLMLALAWWKLSRIDF
jgi:ABC-type transport system involved in multi-copper enzyme maturation permease subunit